MKRWGIPLILVVGLALVALVSLSVPQPAQAGITDHNWSETTYTGYDDFHGTWVAAYEEGGKAKLVAHVRNDAGADVTIKSAKVKFDWGEEYPTTDFPSQIKAGERGLVTFEFDMPAVTTASNWTTRDYEIVVEYEVQDGPTEIERVSGRHVGWGDGSETKFQLPHNPIFPGSESLYLVDWAADTVTPTTAYTIDNLTGEIEFTTAPAAGLEVKADYRHAQVMGWGDGVSTVFYLWNAHVVPDSQAVYLRDEVADTFAAVPAGDYSIDNETGKIAFATAPTSWQEVWATYEYYRAWTAGGSPDFAIYSADQADAMELKQELEVGWFWEVPADARALLSQSAEEAEMGDEDYAAGNFADAKTHYETALNLKDQAIEADSDLVKENLNVPAVAAWLGGIGLLIFGFGVFVFAFRWRTS